MASRSWPASGGSGPEYASWWASGVSGSGTPTIAAIFGPQIPAQSDGVGGQLTPVVATPVTRPACTEIPLTSCRSSTRTPRAAAARSWASTARTDFAMPSVGVCSPPSTTSRSSSGCSATHSSGPTTRASTPHDVSPPAAPVELGEPLRGGGDLQPTHLQVARLPVQLQRAELLDGVAGHLRHGPETGWPGTPAPARATTTRPALAGVSWSTTVTEVQPRAESSSARAAPTTPAPMITTTRTHPIPPGGLRALAVVFARLAGRDPAKTTASARNPPGRGSDESASRDHRRRRRRGRPRR